MKHIKTPVRCFASASRGMYLQGADGEILAKYHVGVSLEIGEIVDAINAYDADRARIKELEAQVEALVGACEAVIDLVCYTSDPLPVRLQIASTKAQSALALVRRDEREITRFLWLPLTIRNKTRWLCRATWKEQYYKGANCAAWLPERFVNTKRPIAEQIAQIDDSLRWRQ